MRAHPLGRGIFLTCLIAGTLGIAALVACAGPPSPPSPPPAEPHTAFAPVEVKVQSDPDWLAAGFGSVWVKRPEGFVSRIDAGTATVTEEIRVHPTSEEQCGGMGPGTDAMWTCSSHDLVRIDPETNAVVATIPAGKIPGQGRLARAAGRIWVLAGEGDRLVGVAEADGSTSEPITLPVACHDLGAAADIVYVVCERADRVLRIDPASSTVTANVAITKPAWVSASAGGVWISTDQDLFRLDPTTLSTAVLVKGLGTGERGAIWADDKGVWVRRVDPFLTRVDASTGYATRVISAPFRSGGDVVVDGDHLWASDFDARVLIRLEVPTGP
jgi:virginiamycin B lyase